MTEDKPPSLTPRADGYANLNPRESWDYDDLLELARELETNLYDTQFVLESVHETNRVLLAGMEKLKAENDKLKGYLERINRTQADFSIEKLCNEALGISNNYLIFKEDK